MKNSLFLALMGLLFTSSAHAQVPPVVLPPIYELPITIFNLPAGIRGIAKAQIDAPFQGASSLLNGHPEYLAVLFPQDFYAQAELKEPNLVELKILIKDFPPKQKKVLLRTEQAAQPDLFVFGFRKECDLPMCGNIKAAEGKITLTPLDATKSRIDLDMTFNFDYKSGNISRKMREDEVKKIFSSFVSSILKNGRGAAY